MTRALRPRTALALWLCAGIVASLLGCASAPPTERTVLAGNAARSLVILPLNVAAVMPSGLEAASPAVWEELELYLREQGKELKTVSFESARRLWLRCIRDARSANARAGFDDAARLLVAELASRASFDAVIAPSLYLREAPITGRSAAWDGVERTLEIEGGRLLPGDVPLDGVAPAASLHAVVLGPRGERIQEGIGGLDLLVAARVRRKPSSGPDALRIEFTPRSDPFSRREHLREGIARALSPFLPPLSPAADRAAAEPRGAPQPLDDARPRDVGSAGDRALEISDRPPERVAGRGDDEAIPSLAEGDPRGPRTVCDQGYGHTDDHRG